MARSACTSRSAASTFSALALGLAGVLLGDLLLLCLADAGAEIVGQVEHGGGDQPGERIGGGGRIARHAEQLAAQPEPAEQADLLLAGDVGRHATAACRVPRAQPTGPSGAGR
jgi:hypothetical protein